MKRRTSVSPKKNMENGWLILIFKKTFHLLYEHCEKAELQYSNILREMTFAKKKNFAHKFYATEAKFSVPQKLRKSFANEPLGRGIVYSQDRIY